MIGQLKSLGIGGGLGTLTGIPLMIWIAPTTSSGAVVIIALCTLTGFVAGETAVLIARLRALQRNQKSAMVSGLRTGGKP